MIRRNGGDQKLLLLPKRVRVHAISARGESVRLDQLTLALASPMRSGKLYVEHPSGAIPSFLNGVWNVAGTAPENFRIFAVLHTQYHRRESVK